MALNRPVDTSQAIDRSEVVRIHVTVERLHPQQHLAMVRAELLEPIRVLGPRRQRVVHRVLQVPFVRRRELSTDTRRNGPDDVVQQRTGVVEPFPEFQRERRRQRLQLLDLQDVNTVALMNEIEIKRMVLDECVAWLCPCYALITIPGEPIRPRVERLQCH